MIDKVTGAVFQKQRLTKNLNAKFLKQKKMEVKSDLHMMI